jgi:ABC-type proline/glycine betaine transport system permease subunit
MGGLFGVGLAIVMARFKVLERGLLPYVIVSQTVPLIALAPLVAAIGGNWDLPKWTLGRLARRVPGVLPDRGRHPEGPERRARRVAGADGQLRRRMVAHPVQAAPARGGAHDGPGDQARSHRSGDRRDRVRDLHRCTRCRVRLI